MALAALGTVISGLGSGLGVLATVTTTVGGVLKILAAIVGLQSGQAIDRMATGIDKIERNTRPMRDASRFDVLGVSGAVFPPGSDVEAFKNHPAITGVTPAEADHRGTFVVLLEPVAIGNIGLAMAAGVVPVQINVTDEAHPFADVNDGVATSLKSGPFGSAQEPGKVRIVLE